MDPLGGHKFELGSKYHVEIKDRVIWSPCVSKAQQRKIIYISYSKK